MTTEKSTDQRIPVTVLTGFLGAGKTTLLNRILTEEHGHRIAVIENEFGEIGIDHALVIDADEEIFEMNNGCICCTVRGDLIRILSRLIKRRDQFDRILVETTGLADPGPVAQTFFVDDELSRKFRLDGIVTVIDAGHVALHIDDSPECGEQIAFADALIINKTDLVDDEVKLDDLEKRLRAINPVARLRRAINADVAIDEILNLGGFDVDRALAVDPKFLTPEYPFEWGGFAALEKGEYTLDFQPGADPKIDAVLLPAKPDAELADYQEQAVLLFSDEPTVVEFGEDVSTGPHLSRIKLSMDEPISVPLSVPTTGPYAFFLEHFPHEFELQLRRKGAPADECVSFTQDRAFIDDHEHDDTVSSVGIRITGDLDPEMLNEWLMQLLTEHGPDIFRMKGILSMAGCDERFVFQGVHMLFDSKPQHTWKKDEERRSEMIFIGRNLDGDLLNKGFERCLV